jgi:putative DNA primase/helicase
MSAPIPEPNGSTGPIARVLDHLRGVHRGGAGWMARCPHHDDRQGSLSIKEAGDGRVLMHCFAGCVTADVVASAGLAMVDLFPPEVPVVPLPTAQVVARHEYPICNLSGEVVAVHKRIEYSDGSKSMPWAGDCVPRDLLFGAELLPKAKDVPVILCEGEKAAAALRSIAGKCVVLGTVCGAASVPSDTALSMLSGRRMWLWPDNDGVGGKHMQAIAKALEGDVAELRIIDWSAAPPKGDAADFVQTGADTAAFVTLCREATTPTTSAVVAVVGLFEGPNASTPPQPAPAVGVLLADVQPEPITWLWPGRLAVGKVTMLDGDPGLGKSVLTLDWAARLTRGLPWPDGAPCPIGGAVILSAEDGLADTIRPRLDLAGADMQRVVALQIAGTDDHEVTIPADLGTVELAIDRVDAALVIVDPLMAYLGSETNSYRDQDVRRALRPLAGLAERKGVAVVVIRHLNKAVGGPALYRGGGSIGILAAARIALLVGADPDDEDRRVLVPVKTNISRKPPALAYRLVEDALGTVRVVWADGECSLTAAALLAAPTGDPEPASAVGEAEEFLAETLRESPSSIHQLLRHAREIGISEKTLRRAKERLGVVAKKTGMRGGWEWSLPEDGQETPKMVTPAEWPSSASVGHLRQVRESDDVPSAGTTSRLPVGLKHARCPQCGRVATVVSAAAEDVLCARCTPPLKVRLPTPKGR